MLALTKALNGVNAGLAISEETFGLLARAVVLPTLQRIGLEWYGKILM